MRRYFQRSAAFVTVLLFGSMLAACGGSTSPVGQPTNAPAPTSAPVAEATSAPSTSGTNLQVIWFAWEPCQALATLAKTYPDATVEVRCVPIGQWHDQIFTDFAAKGGADLVILDSQFIGEAVVGNHVVELTDWMNSEVETNDFVPEALSAYGEYPPTSKRYYGVAIEGDTQMLVYRKDLFADTAIQEAFQQQQGKALEVPTTWSDLLTVAQFFKTTPDDVDKVPNGFATFWCGTPACYDQVQTAWNQIAWSFGGELWDPATYKVEGILNSPTNLQALEFAAELFKTGPEGAGDFQFNETVSALCDGSVAMGTIWFGFGPAFTDPSGCNQSANLDYALVPGEVKQITSLGGMGISVSNYSKNPDAALAFLAWLESKPTQIEWAKLGGFSARISVLESSEFSNAAPYNPLFSEAYLNVKDFWNVPEYNQLLQIQGEQLNLAITGQADPQSALDLIASEQQSILDAAYPDGPPK